MRSVSRWKTNRFAIDLMAVLPLLTRSASDLALELSEREQHVEHQPPHAPFPSLCALLGNGCAAAKPSHQCALADFGSRTRPTAEAEEFWT